MKFIWVIFVKQVEQLSTNNSYNSKNKMTLCNCGAYNIRPCSPSLRGWRETVAQRRSTPTTRPPSRMPALAPWCRPLTRCWARPHPQVFTLTIRHVVLLETCSAMIFFFKLDPFKVTEMFNFKHPTGQLYVMMSPQEVMTGSNQRTIAPRTQPYIA